MLRLCTLADIPDQDAKGFRTPLGEVIVVRRGVEVYCYLNSCPHIGIGLNFQPDVFMDLSQRYLLCANHGALFRIEDGYCVRGPCSGQSLKKMTLSVENGIIWLNT
ncbi:Rieske (2Fe-2S) protein [Agitococcus lubricus]|uniref:Nitrite reductase/ring-hydroxylating ferredoxin subunit n=1 Tax=Agitococcus lubricus TaxID=1077255 RepID=A0A2T5IVD2_9GAMM|nr:Rieske 2Fe-2S domain-containing protein [Agitococcus lubricus]PTQ87847.1 nitrite reductase/ring-hydroxylating ferredoxin subunit [Agitococcus lubricus]